MDAAQGAPGQVPKEKRIDISEKQLTGSRLFPEARNVFKQPAQLQAAEVCAQRQPGLRPEAVLPAFTGEARDVFLNPCVLPNDGIRHWFAGLALPEDCGLPLIGNADGGQIRSAQPALLERFSDHFFRAAQDFQRVMLHPARLWEYLLVLFLRYRSYPRRLVKHHESRARRSLI